MRPMKQWEKWLEILNNRIWKYYIAAGFLALGIALLSVGFNGNVGSDDKIVFLSCGPLAILAGLVLTFLFGRDDFATMRSWQICAGCNKTLKPESGAKKALAAEIIFCKMCGSYGK